MQQGEQLSLEVARKAVSEADRAGMGAVAAYARLQLARAAAAQGEALEALEAAVRAVPGLAVASELGDAGQILRWRGEPEEAWGGLSIESRADADKRAWMEAGLHATGAALDMACGADSAALRAMLSMIEAGAALPWMAASARWSGVLRSLAPVLLGLSGKGQPEGQGDAAVEPDAVIWQTLARTTDARRSLVQRYADSLGVLVSLCTGGLEYRPLRVAVGRCLLHTWSRSLREQPFLFRQPALRRARVDELYGLILDGDLDASAQMMKTLADGVAVGLPWELQSWLEAPFEGVQSSVVVDE